MEIKIYLINLVFLESFFLFYVDLNYKLGIKYTPSVDKLLTKSHL